jgi:hypothetical protein
MIGEQHASASLPCHRSRHHPRGTCTEEYQEEEAILETYLHALGML